MSNTSLKKWRICLNKFIILELHRCDAVIIGHTYSTNLPAEVTKQYAILESAQALIRPPGTQCTGRYF